MEYQSLFFSPSELFDRLDRLQKKMEFDRLTPEEEEEFDFLQEQFQDSYNEDNLDFMF